VKGGRKRPVAGEAAEGGEGRMTCRGKMRVERAEGGEVEVSKRVLEREGGCEMDEINGERLLDSRISDRRSRRSEKWRLTTCRVGTSFLKTCLPLSHTYFQLQAYQLPIT
jgi:hypothetical protein